MGVRGLWQVLEPVSKPIKLESLAGQKLAVDASIWIYHFLKAVRDGEGNVLKHAHVIGFFRRICKLLYFGILPVFVFDGGAPALKRNTILRRKDRRDVRMQDARKTAQRLLTVQMHRLAQNDVDRATKKRRAATSKNSVNMTDDELANATYFDERGNGQKVIKKFRAADQYHLPEVSQDDIDVSDPRFLNEEELKQYEEEFQDQITSAGLYDTSKMDFESPEFLSMPITLQYQLLNSARLRSRLRMGYSAEQLDKLFPDRKEFSKFQIQRVAQRNFLTQQLMNISGEEGSLRVSGEKGKEYILEKVDNGGWVLNRTSGVKAEVIEDETQKRQSDIVSEDEEVDEDIEWEDVTDVKPEQSNSLHEIPKQQSSEGLPSNLSSFESALQRKKLYESIARRENSGAVRDEVESKSERNTKETKQDDSDLFGSENSDNEKEVAELPPWFDRTSRSTIDGSKALLPNVSNNFAKTSNVYHLERAREDWESESDGEGDANQLFINSASTGSHFAPARATAPSFSLHQGTGQLHVVEEEDEDHEFEDLDLGGKSEPEKGKNESVDETRIQEDDLSFKEEEYRCPKPNNLERTIMSDAISDEVSDNREAQNTNISAEIDSGHVHAKNFQPVGAKAPIEEKERSENVESTVAPVTPNATVVVSSDDASELAEINELAVYAEPPIEPKSAEQSSAEIEQNEYSRYPTDSVGNHDREKPVVVSKNDDSTPPQEPDLQYATEFDRELALQEAEFEEIEDEELLEQLVREAEENEKFATSINNGYIAKQSQADFEREIKSLKTQMKKDNRDADEVTENMIADCQELLRYFGVPYISAPMEAEAQCAQLMELGLVDGVVTDDNDCFLFGGRRVFKNMFNQSKFVEAYDMVDLEKIGLDRDKLIRLALFLGSDYTDGVKGIGAVTALELMGEFDGENGLQDFKEWWEQVELKKDTGCEGESEVKRKFRKNAGKIFLPDSFPDARVIEAYRSPQVDTDKTPFSWGQPNVDSLRTCIQSSTGWSAEKVDETLIPVVRDMNKKRSVQTTLDTYLHVPTDKRIEIMASKRMKKALQGLKK